MKKWVSRSAKTTQTIQHFKFDCFDRRAAAWCCKHSQILERDMLYYTIDYLFEEFNRRFCFKNTNLLKKGFDFRIIECNLEFNHLRAPLMLSKDVEQTVEALQGQSIHQFRESSNSHHLVQVRCKARSLANVPNMGSLDCQKLCSLAEHVLSFPCLIKYSTLQFHQLQTHLQLN